MCFVLTQTPKISNRLFSKTKKSKRKKEAKEPEPLRLEEEKEEEEFDIQDGPSIFKVKPEKQQAKPKRRGKKKAKREKYQLTNGDDSDSVDLDMLSTFNRYVKTTTNKYRCLLPDF